MRKYTQKNKPTQLVTGRQNLFKVYEWCRVEEDDKAAHDVKRLLALNMHGNVIARFHHEWDAELLRQEEEVPLHLKHILYHAQVENTLGCFPKWNISTDCQLATQMSRIVGYMTGWTRFKAERGGKR